MYSGLSDMALGVVRELFNPPHEGEVGVNFADVVEELKAAGLVNAIEASQGKTIRVTLTDAARAFGAPPA